ncbi:MAG: SRPBCC family protein [Pirellulales bacterium]|nr:SRPBCC family protein [Pirellulales bacterium]
MPRTHTFIRTQLIRRPLEEVFAFFSDAANLEVITPPFLHFKILSPQPIPMHPGAVIDYQLRLYGVTFRWRTIIESYDPPRRFSDTQARGPYKLWHHTHEFYEVPEGVLMIDRVRYQMPYWLLGNLAHGLFVKSTLERIFDYRYEQIARLLPDELPEKVLQTA